MKLAQDRLTYHHEMRVGSGITPWFGAAVNGQTSPVGNGTRTARAREGSFGLQMERAAWGDASQADPPHGEISAPTAFPCRTTPRKDASDRP